MIRKLLFLFLFSAFVYGPLCSGQTKGSTANSDQTQGSHDGRSFRGIKLLSSYDEVSKQVKNDELLILNPVSDFEDFDETTPNWLIANMPPLINKAYFHFLDNKLYVISLFFNPKKTSYSELYQNLKKNYGAPTRMNAQESRWEIPNTIIILDALPSIKYIDNGLLDKLKKDNETKTPLTSLDEQEKALEAQILADL